MTVQIPRPKRGGEGQWGLGYREPLTLAEQTKRDDDGLNVYERILEYAEKWQRGEITSVEQIFVGDLRSRFRWYGLYTQRPEEDGYFMWRIRIPGGVLTSDATRTIGRISEEFGRDVADVTDRQNVQLHWIRLPDVPEIWERLAAVGLGTTEACGDTPRNILGCPLAGVDATEILDATDLIIETDKRVVGDPEFSNLPRKYKTSITGCRHQCAVHEANDLAFVGSELPDGSKGFDVWVGGGLSSTSCTTGTQQVSPNGTASPLSGPGSNLMLNGGAIPLGATEVDNGRLSPLIITPLPVPGVTVPPSMPSTTTLSAPSAVAPIPPADSSACLGTTTPSAQANGAITGSVSPSGCSMILTVTSPKRVFTFLDSRLRTIRLTG